MSVKCYQVMIQTDGRALCPIRMGSKSGNADSDVQRHCSFSSDDAAQEKAVLPEESPPLASAFNLSTSFDDDVLDLK
jgi:hypothetical protein